LVFVDPASALAALAPFGAISDVDGFHVAERQARLNLSRVMATQGPVSERKAWRGYFSTLLRGLGVPEAEREAAGRTLFEAHEREHMWTRVEDSTVEALDTLRAQGYRLGVVSNADGRMPDLLDQVGLADRFEFVIDSHVVGVTKPDPRIFAMAVERLDLPAAACMYVGDLYAVDVVGARRAGLRAVLLDPFDELELPVSRVARVGDLPDWLGRSA
jgi:putative hydrolase of the HAD superfamily